VEVDDDVERTAVEDAFELLGLRQVAREAVEYEPVGQRPARRQALFDHADHYVVGDELTRVHVALRLEPERGARLRLRAEQITGGHVREPVMLGETLRLRPLAGTLLAEQDETRELTHGATPGYRRKPS